MNALLARLGAVAIVFGMGLWLGFNHATLVCKAKQGKAMTQAVVTHNVVAEVGQTVERANTQRATKTEAVFNGIHMGVTTYAQSHPAALACRLDDNGLRLWSAANANTEALPASDRDAVLPSAPAAAERADDGPADQPYRRGAGVSPVPGSAPGLDRLAGENP